MIAGAGAGSGVGAGAGAGAGTGAGAGINGVATEQMTPTSSVDTEETRILEEPEKGVEGDVEASDEDRHQQQQQRQQQQQQQQLPKTSH